MEEASSGAGAVDTQAYLRRQRVFEWYIGLAIGMVLLAVAFGGKFTTPIHVNFLGEWSWLPLSDWGLWSIACAAFTGIVSVVLERLNKTASETGKLAAGSLLFCGVFLFCAQGIVEGANVHFDSSPVARVTTQIVRIEPAPSGSKRGATLHLANWGGGDPAKVVKARQDVRVFRMDMDKKNATFYVRKGFFGVPYASEYK
ncbi:hypothetical protein [Polaromonas aquatica]|uniref:hypothetical protein n=1 Tax=Polaromonas aquatica TaxID=332657 RepID=UPI003D645CA3